MIQRMNTLSFIEFIKGRYLLEDVEYIQLLFNMMTDEEVELIQNVDSYKKLYGTFSANRINLRKGRSNYNYLKKLGILEKVIGEHRSIYNDNEWGFPKGRRNLDEMPLETAMRELEEETNISPDDYELTMRRPEIEIFNGTNGLLYKHIYYRAQYKYPTSIALDNFTQNEEIKQIGWFDREECKARVRQFYRHRIKMIDDL
jgi:8-oxo-dGTP pyrophosphatase MutT (NUDIX family)